MSCPYTPPGYEGRRRPDQEAEAPPPPGQAAILTAALLVGILLMAIQLWLLTVSLDLYLGGKGREVWQLALLSGGIFVGGLIMIRLTQRRPRMHGSYGPVKHG